MIPSIREQYNEEFTEEKYRAYISELENIYPGHLEFRIAETPVFVPADFTRKMIDACEHIIDVISEPSYKTASERAMPAGLKVPNEDAYPHFIAFDFGVCQNETGQLEPQLIEMQGFPSLFAWEVLLPEVHQHHFHTPRDFSVYFNRLDRDSYIELLKQIIIADADPSEVILLEILPHQQKTRVDFYATKQLIGIETVCLTELIKEGRQLFYLKDGRKTRVRRIYNRVIFDDLQQQSPEIQEKGKIFQDDLDVTWVPHPNWFYRLSKFTLPFIRHPYVPETRFLHEAGAHENLADFVVKPLFSFAGQGVIIDVTREDIKAIPNPEEWIIQRKVRYADVIKTPSDPAKAEIRIFYFWPPGASRPLAANNLARLSKGKMIGVRYNKDKEWVGGTFALLAP